jgi:hypothetical protein
MQTLHAKRLSAAALLSASIFLISACGDTAPSSSVPAAPVQITGHVMDDDGPVNQAKIEAKDAQGMVAARVALKGDSNRYQLTVPAGTRYPLILTAYPESPPTEPLKAAVVDASAREQDISQVTTIVVETALSLGGLTEANLAKAAGAAIAQRKKSGGGSGGGATTQSFKGDPTKQYGGWH